jgi:cytidylate kinase
MDGKDFMRIVAIDGPAGAGKSTIAKLLAKKLGFAFLDTGAMYRALTYKAMETGTDLTNEAALVALAGGGTQIQLQGEQENLRVILDGQDVSDAIRSISVTNNTFYIARAAGVRRILVEWQRAMGEDHDVVAEGRDIGTVVFPSAPFKFYLDASVEERARRRAKELKDKGKEVDPDQLKQEIIERDNNDFQRKVGPLKKAPDAIVVDSTALSIEQVIEHMMKYIHI